jgi:endonuclease G, mitochondrial
VAFTTPNLIASVDKALSRAGTTDFSQLQAQVRDASPAQLSSAREKRERQKFLQSLYAEQSVADQLYERIIAGNDLQNANFLPRGALVARAVLRIVLKSANGAVRGYGTGFLVADQVLMTNHHVFPNSDSAHFATAEASYELGVDDSEQTPIRFALQPDRFFYPCNSLDFSLVAVASQDITGREPLAQFGWLPLIGGPGKANEGEWLNIIQHPKGERKQLCVRDNQLMKRDTDVLWYSSDSQAGSSGSPVLNNDWLVVALHHSGVPDMKDGNWLTKDGRPFDKSRDSEDDIKWIANEGIRVSRIIETLRTDNSIAHHPMLSTMLNTNVTDVRANLPVFFASGTPPPVPLSTAIHPSFASCPPKTTQEVPMTQRHITITLEFDDSGKVSIAGQKFVESDVLEKVTLRDKFGNETTIDAPVDPTKDWAKDKGYKADFLDGHKDFEVHLPIVLDPNVKNSIAPLIDAYGMKFTDDERTAGELKYLNYSVVMNMHRRFALFSAANVNSGNRFLLSGRDDNWQLDQRISIKHQVPKEFYKRLHPDKDNPMRRFDKGHLTRRDDLNWGHKPVDAVRSSNGTFTMPNCTPQHAVFNERVFKRGVIMWQGLEQYVLTQLAPANQSKVQVITGPIFSDDDPEYHGIQCPMRFWKVIAGVNENGALFAVGFMLDQAPVIDEFGLDEAAAVTEADVETVQVEIADIEFATGLEFTCGNIKQLRDFDSLMKYKKAPTLKRKRVTTPKSKENATLESWQDAFTDIIL